jgi:ABC-2 type transport system ATP-binding protein
MISISNLQKTYNDKLVLDIPQLTINTGESVGLVGNNGAGKSTLLSLILDIIEPTNGVVLSKEQEVHTNENWKHYTGSYLNEGFLIPYLTPYEFISFVATLHQKTNEECETFLTENEAFIAITKKDKTLIRDLSAGNRNKVGILAALFSNPEILILDEPFSFLDPTSQSWLKNKLNALRQSGITMLISSHDLGHITEISNRILILENGILVDDKPTTNETLIELEKYFRVESVI